MSIWRWRGSQASPDSCRCRSCSFSCVLNYKMYLRQRPTVHQINPKAKVQSSSRRHQSPSLNWKSICRRCKNSCAKRSDSRCLSKSRMTKKISDSSYLMLSWMKRCVFWTWILPLMAYSKFLLLGDTTLRTRKAASPNHRCRWLSALCTKLKNCRWSTPTCAQLSSSLRNYLLATAWINRTLEA